uniref:Uncharacterized protein n=1 Tax=Glyptapanteles flavicoxis TaxID=463051 RepID=B7S881_9HYME|nr:conserved hypothetical protein [Glyptapanteles flavicoxis]
MASLVALSIIIGTFFQGIGASSMQEGQKNGTIKLPTIVYGPINQQLGNDYQSVTPTQTSGESTQGASVIYGSTTSQKNNKYLTIGQAENVYVMVSTINEPLFVPIPGLVLIQNASTDGPILDSKNPTGTQIKKIINAFNTFQKLFDRIMRIASPFLTQNEIGLLQQKKARDDFDRQTKEIKWLSAVASQRMKLVKLYEQIIFIKNSLSHNLEISHEEIVSARDKVKDLSHSETRLKHRTQDLVVCVLSQLFLL